MKYDLKGSNLISVVMKIRDKIKNIRYNDIVLYMYRPTDPASLGIIRFFFGK